MTPSVTEEYVPQYAPPVSYGTHHKALEVACYYQNRYTELIGQLVHYKGLVEMFCLDAEAAHGTQRDGV